jgi:molecular chaperone DnaK (HSP70)
MSTNKTVWGIDLGTTYSCIARVDENDYPVVINNLQGEPTTPSVVLFGGPDDVTVGADAKSQMQLVPDLVCDLVKQNMGNPDWRFSANGDEWTAPEVSSFILKELASGAEQMTGIVVEDVVITVPAYFGVAEREATIAAGKIAGLNVKNILNEPTAAAFSYGFGQSADAEETVLVYDLGGGTFDVTVIKLEPNGAGGSSIRVAATRGDDKLGGADWDGRLVELLARKFVEAAPDAVDPLDDPLASADLRLKAEGIKRGLTLRPEHKELIIAGTERAQVTVTREEFEDATKDLLERTIGFTKDALQVAAAAGAGQIDRVLLVGGSSFMPAVARRLVEEFPEWTPELNDPNQAVAKGAALAGLRQALLDSIIGEDAASADASGAGPTLAPAPEKVEQAAASFGMSRSMVEKLVTTSISNVCSRGFGVKVIKDGVTPDTHPHGPGPDDYEVSHIIQPQTVLPLTGEEDGRIQTYFTFEDGQDVVMLEIWEQESDDVSASMASNKFLERAQFQMTRPYPRNSPVRVALGMNETGLLRLHAWDPDGHEIEFQAAASSAVISDEQVAESRSKVQAMRQAA